MKKYVKNNASLRTVAAELFKSLERHDVDFRCLHEVGDDFPLEINLYAHHKQTQSNGIRYKINPNGSILFLEGYEPLSVDWTYGELRELRKCGYIDGDITHLIFQIPGGLGSFSEHLEKLILVASIIDFIFGGSPIDIENVKLSPEYHIVQEWLNNNVHSLTQIREFLDEKSIWRTHEVMVRFQLSEEEATKLLSMLGYALEGNIWKLGTTKESLQKRELWLQKEQEEFAKQQQQIEASMRGMIVGN